MATYKELLDQKEKLEAEIQALRKQERSSVIEEIRQKMIDYQISIDEIGERRKFGKAGTRTSAAARYRDPITGKEWCGRGKPPNWIKGAANREPFLIK